MLFRSGNALGDFKENLGQAILEGLKPFTEWLGTVITKLNEATVAKRNYNVVMGTGGKEGDAAAALAMAQSEYLSLKEAVAYMHRQLDEAVSAGKDSRIIAGLRGGLASLQTQLAEAEQAYNTLAHLQASVARQDAEIKKYRESEKKEKDTKDAEAEALAA